MSSSEPMGGSSSRGGQISIEKAGNLLWSRYGASSIDDSFIGMVSIGVISS